MTEDCSLILVDIVIIKDVEGRKEKAKSAMADALEKEIFLLSDASA